MSQVAMMRSGLREIAGELQVSRDRLLGLRGSVPRVEPPGGDRDAEPDPLSEMIAIIECGIHDNLDPLIQDLVTASRYQAKSPRCGRPLGGIDLGQSDDATRRALYELVEKDNFSPPDHADAWIPPYTAEEAELQVFHLHGRWFATWLKLEEPGDTPEARRRELLLLEEMEEHPGVLIYREV